MEIATIQYLQILSNDKYKIFYQHQQPIKNDSSYMLQL